MILIQDLGRSGMAFSLLHLGCGIQGTCPAWGQSRGISCTRQRRLTNCFVTKEQNSSERDERARHFNPFGSLGMMVPTFWRQ